MFGEDKTQAVRRPGSTGDIADLHLDADVVAQLAALLPTLASDTVEAIIVAVPSYAGALQGDMGQRIRSAVELALAGFLQLAGRSRGSDPSAPLGPALEAAYELGRGEARSGRSMEALLAAYRVGARMAWRQLSEAAVAVGLSSRTVAGFAELVFAYIDELSAASVTGHSDELATTGRERQRQREQLFASLLAGAGEDQLVAVAARAEWPPPLSLTAVVLGSAQVRGALAAVSEHTLQGDQPDLTGTDTVVLLVPDMGGVNRHRLLELMRGRRAVVGPDRPWTTVRSSYLRAVAARRLADDDRSVDRRADGGRAGVGPATASAMAMAMAMATEDPLDTEAHLAEIVLTADAEALADLQRRVLAPLDGVRPATAEKLRQTLRSWLLHQGRRDDVAADLFVHPQTVRYRVNQLRELFGSALTSPQGVLELTIALGAYHDAHD